MIFEISETDKDYLQQVNSIRLADIGWLEKDLENLISNNIAQFVPENQLMIISQEKSFQEQADILALDKDGILYIFELKRWESTKENLLQVLRYGQIFGQFSYEKLQDLLRRYHNDFTLNLDEKHLEYFKDQIDKPLVQSTFNKNQHFVVITNVIDLDTLNSVKYWKDKGLKIDCLPFRVYTLHEKHFLEFNSFNPQNEVIISDFSGCYIVNTNITWSETDYKEMLGECKAAAYGSKQKGIKRIKNGDEVFLYHNGVGVIAYGKAVGDPIELYDEDETYIKINFKWKVDPITQADEAVRAWEINQELQAGYGFRQTVFAITKEMADAIKKLKKKKGEKV